MILVGPGGRGIFAFVVVVVALVIIIMMMMTLVDVPATTFRPLMSMSVQSVVTVQ